jgi:hypothetical protein
MTTDEPIDEIREVRHQISAEFGHSTRALLDHYREMEKRYADRMLRKLATGRPPSQLQEADQR